jgi:dTDP-4-dehydrorhamnose reductase
MKVLIAGSNGQLGRALRAVAPAGIEVAAPSKAEFDIASVDQIEMIISRTKPDILFNAAAYTAVDKAESEPNKARLVNATAVSYLAQSCLRNDVQLVHVSTDFVFDGSSSRPYVTDEPPKPLSIYGLTKWEGEQAAGANALIVRTAWVYAANGQNFVRTMLRLMSERDDIKVVADQIGTPTYAPDLAKALWTLAEQRKSSIYHYTDSGVASWYDFAVAIQEEALAIGLLAKAIPIEPISSINYPTLARRPSFSVLDKTKTWDALGHAAPHWRSNLRLMLAETKLHGARL